MYDFLENLFRRLIEPLNMLVDAINRLIEILGVRSDKYARINNILTSAALNSFPAYHLAINLTPVMQEITRNVSAHYIAVRIYNNNAGIPASLGRDNLTNVNGEILPAGAFTVGVLAPGDVLYGMCPVGVVNIRVAVLENLNAELLKLPEERL